MSIYKVYIYIKKEKSHVLSIFYKMFAVCSTAHFRNVKTDGLFIKWILEVIIKTKFVYEKNVQVSF